MHAADPVFTDDKVPPTEPLASDAKPKKNKGGDAANRLFAATPEEKAAEERRKHDHKIGLLIGPKNLVKLRAFGYDCKHLGGELASGVAHRGLNE